VIDVVDELLDLDATDQAAAVERGDVSAEELIEAAIERVVARNPALNAVIHERFDAARREARTVTGPFAGVPFVVKDLIAHGAGDAFHEGISGVREAGYRAATDTALVRRFKDAGLVTIGRTNTPELGMQAVTEPIVTGPTHNPWHLDRSPLGSSGGTAAAVSSGMVPVGHGNDGGGSLRVPASACGLVGLKPSRGRVSLGPEFGDIVGGVVAELGLTRSVRDTAALLDIAATTDFTDEPYAPPFASDSYRGVVARAAATDDALPVRVGMMTRSPGRRVPVDEQCTGAVERAGGLLEQLGCGVDLSHPDALDDAAFPRHAAILLPFAFTAYALDWWERHLGRPLGADDVEPLTWRFAEAGRALTAVRYLAAVEWIQSWSRRVTAWWHDHDILLTPTVPIPPPPSGVADGDLDAALALTATIIAFTSPFNMTGQPAISLPMASDHDGVPIGVQLVAAPGREDLLLTVAARIERAAPWPHLASRSG
jgi:amidase